jgi:TRAP-type transport system small permease protein
MIVRVVRICERGLDLLARWMAGAAALALCAIVGITFAGVVMRKLFDTPLQYTEELVGLLLCATLFLALPQVTLAGRHVRVTLLAERLGERARAYLALFAAAVTLGFCAWFLAEGLPWLDLAIRRSLRSEASDLLLWPWMALPVISIATCALITLARLGSGAEGRAAAVVVQSESRFDRV